jgi:hypothetical protein
VYANHPLPYRHSIFWKLPVPLSWNEIRNNAIRFSKDWAHTTLDRAVDACYRREKFTSERVEFLFTLYEKLATPLTAEERPTRRSKTVRVEDQTSILAQILADLNTELGTQWQDVDVPQLPAAPGWKSSRAVLEEWAKKAKTTLEDWSEEARALLERWWKEKMRSGV